MFVEVANFNELVKDGSSMELLNVLFCEVCFLFFAFCFSLSLLPSPTDAFLPIPGADWQLDELTAAAGCLKVETVGPVYMVRHLRAPGHAV